jgi:uncharacterized protein involved in outer membrane biogenesis
MWTVGGVIGGVLLLWIALNLLLADARFGTPAVNWALHTFGSKTANVESGKLRHPFSSTFVITKLNWPERATAADFQLTYNLFGFLPAVPWAKEIAVTDGELTLMGQSDGKSTFQPQKLVDRINARNVKLNFMRRGEPRMIHIIEASGSLADGTARAEAVAGDNHLSFDGLASAAAGSSLRGHVTARGQNLKDLAEIIGATAPDTPPFNVRGDLSSATHSWTVDNITGRMGDSDIAGRVKVDLGQSKPFLDVALSSQRLDFDDLGVVFGIPIGAGRGETANDEQRAAKAASDRSARLIPDSRIDLDRLRAVNARFRFTSPRIVDAPFGIRSMTMQGTLNDQVLEFTTARVDMSGGNVDAHVRVDANQQPVVTTARGTVAGVNIGRTLSAANYVRGDAQGVFNVTLRGSGFREAFGSTTGEIGLWSRNSQLSKFATEAAALDLGELLLHFNERNSRNAPFLRSRCLAAAATVRNGVATLNPAVLDNEDTLILVKGGLNLNNERLNLEIEAHPKDISIGTLKGNVEIVGTLRNPQIRVLDEDTLFQGILAALAGPLAALPFVELGGGDDAPCGELLADARAAGDGRLARDNNRPQPAPSPRGPRRG